MPSNDLLSMTISEMAPKIQAGEVSPVELTEAALAEAHRQQPKLNSFITIMDEQAMGQARELEEQLYNLDETVSILRAAAESQLYAEYATVGRHQTTQPEVASALARADALHAVADGFQAPASTRQALIAAVQSLREHDPATVEVTVRVATECLRAETPEAVSEAFRVASESLIKNGSPAISMALLEVAYTLDDQGPKGQDAAIEALSDWLEDKAAPVVADVLMALANGLEDDTPPTVAEFVEPPTDQKGW